MIRTTETVLWTRALCTMQSVLITVITTIIVAIAQPIWFNANICFLAFEMIGRAGCVLWTTFVRLIGSGIVFAVIDAIADL